MSEVIENQSNNKRIVKNTLLLYFRMILTMGVSLYTVRIVLNTLGVVDYGIYNVVGGIVVMFSFLSNTMASASERFLAFELGRNNHDQLKKTFSMTMMIYILIALVILLLAETLGLWFLNTQMSIPTERMEAANWIYQFSILSFMMTMFTVPYNAAIIAHERMNVYAYVSIIEVILKLAIVYILLLFSFDKLKLYSVLVFCVTTLVTLIYRTYSIRQFKECKLSFFWDKGLFKELTGYSAWNLIGALSGILKNYGVNILLNMFFGPIVNAARGIAYQINGVVMQFVLNFFQAVNPQITKYYAADDIKNLEKLVFQSAKLSYFLLFLLSAPVFLETHFILSIWLENIPDYTIIFVRLIIIANLVDSLANPLITVALATGKIKKYQITVGGILLLNLPFSYLLLKFGYSPESTLYALIGTSVLALFYRLYNLKQMIDFPILRFSKEVILHALIITILSLVPSFYILWIMPDGISRLLFVSFFFFLVSAILIYVFGLSKGEKTFIYTEFKRKLRKNYD